MIDQLNGLIVCVKLVSIVAEVLSVNVVTLATQSQIGNDGSRDMGRQKPSRSLEISKLFVTLNGHV